MTTRATYHADSSEPDVTQAKAQIAAILKERDCREWAISSKGLADAVGLKPTTVRDCIKEIRRERHIPIVSCSSGYYVISDVAQLESELDRIQAEINTRKETRHELAEAFNHTKYE